MPNRIIKESVCTSEEINALTDAEECFFYRLLTACDDFGLMDARPVILKARCYPLKSIDINCIQMMLGVLQSHGLIRLYEVAGKPYLSFVSWEKHQQIRAKKPKYPIPQDGSDINCNQLQANVPVIQSNPIQSTSVARDCIAFDGSSFQNLSGHVEVWRKAYPAIDVEDEVRKAAAWLVSNPKNRKKALGRFLNGWLSRAQDKAPRVPNQERRDWI